MKKIKEIKTIDVAVMTKYHTKGFFRPRKIETGKLVGFSSEADLKAIADRLNEVIEAINDIRGEKPPTEI